MPLTPQANAYIHPTSGDWDDEAEVWPDDSCEDQCNHDCARGVLTSDLFREDGPEFFSTTLHIPRGSRFHP